MSKKLQNLRIGLVDADLLDGGTRHPNLALLKIAGILYDNCIPFNLIYDKNEDISKYNHIFMSRVFTFTKEPDFYINASAQTLKKFHVGGTGYYATETDIAIFKSKREEDLNKLENDSFLKRLKNKYGLKDSPFGIDMARQMPYYHLYDEFINAKIMSGDKRQKYKDYLDFSIGFLTRKCYRHCPFCVNKLENGVVEYSKLEWFHDKERPLVYFWDDNFLAAPKNIWEPILQDLIDRKIRFQFRQGLDERQFAENEHGELMAEMLAKTNYYGDFIFAFDNWKDRPIIEKSLKIWKKYCPTKTTKFYLFCGFQQHNDKENRFYKDIVELFSRIKVLMQYGCCGYVMRHEDYHNAPIPNFYVQVARWCNQPAFYKKMSFWEFCYRNQSYWEQKTLKKKCKDQLDFKSFLKRKENGYYQKGKNRLCLPVKTILDILDMFPNHREELLVMFNYKYMNLCDKKNWEE